MCLILLNTVWFVSVGIWMCPIYPNKNRTSIFITSFCSVILSHKKSRRKNVLPSFRFPCGHYIKPTTTKNIWNSNLFSGDKMVWSAWCFICMVTALLICRSVFRCLRHSVETTTTTTTISSFFKFHCSSHTHINCSCAWVSLLIDVHERGWFKLYKRLRIKNPIACNHTICEMMRCRMTQKRNVWVYSKIKYCYDQTTHDQQQYAWKHGAIRTPRHRNILAYWPRINRKCSVRRVCCCESKFST